MGSGGPAPAFNQFVGRECELVELRRGLDETGVAHGRLYLLAGEPGIGKTRLAEELASEARERRISAVWARCWEAAGVPAYWPWVQILRSFISDERPGHRPVRLSPELGKLLPDLAIEAPEPSSAPGDPQYARFRLFDAVANLLKAQAVGRPLMLVIDDLHEADEPSLEMLKFVALQLRESPVLLIGTYRDAEVRRSTTRARLVGEIARVGTEINLRGLSMPDVAV